MRGCGHEGDRGKSGGQAERHVHGRPTNTPDLSHPDSHVVDARCCEATLQAWLRGDREFASGAASGQTSKACQSARDASNIAKIIDTSPLQLH